MARIVDQYGRPVDTGKLVKEEARPTLTGVRSILSEHPARGLTPQRLASLLLEAEDSDATRYLELAEDMEERDLHYLAQLGTRKRAVAQLDITVEAASDAADDVRDADLVREFVRSALLEDTLVDILDAVGKGYSVCELIWELNAREWRIQEIIWRDPRWFAFDPTDGKTLMLREGAELRPLTDHKYLVHVHKAKSGLPIRGGLARAVAWVYLFKNYTLKDWVAFAEVFGQPYRVGKYPGSATEDDKAKLLSAVAQIGSDAAAIIPEGMAMDFIEAQRSGSIDLYARLLSYLDAQVSKAVVGQTLTADVSSDGGSRALGEVHDNVRGDIRRSDARQLEATLNRQLVEPLVAFNHGRRKHYPRLRLGLPDELSTIQKIEALAKAVPLGLDVEVSDVRDLLGFPEPEPGARVLEPAAPTLTAPQARRPRLRARSVAAHSEAAHAEADGGDAIDSAVRAALEDGGWERTVTPVVDPVRKLLEEAEDLEEVRRRLGELLETEGAAEVAERLARATFAARLAGELDVDLEG